MKKQDHFQTSKTLYAVDLNSLKRWQIGTVQLTGKTLYRYEISTVWFKRRKGLDTANIGTLSEISTQFFCPECREAVLFLEKAMIDSIYGGHCRSRWDGSRLWSNPSLDRKDQEIDFKFLDSMLDRYPEIPVGYDGWWSFK